jgi:hypothetical protein
MRKRLVALIKNMKNFKRFLTVFLFLLEIVISSDKFNEAQIIIMLNEYFISEKGPILLGHRFYETKNNNVMQLEIEEDEQDPNFSLLFSFKAMSLVSNISDRDFNLGVLIMHSESRITPIVAKTDLNCAQKFFLNNYIGEKKWRKNCLTIKHN